MRRIIPVILATVILTACSSIDCPVNNTVYAKYVLGGEVDAIPGTLTVKTKRANGSDTTLLNELSFAKDFLLPISYVRPTDILVFQLTDTNAVTYIDTVKLSKINTPHFESVDCSPSYFHQLTGVTWTKKAIDSIIISNSKVTYDTTGGHVQIYFKSDL